MLRLRSLRLEIASRIEYALTARCYTALSKRIKSSKELLSWLATLLSILHR
ncbi:MAG: hypothetical protein ACTS73_00340 [Arsenophonus sp. NEOnobi-MAG3]